MLRTWQKSVDERYNFFPLSIQKEFLVSVIACLCFLPICRLFHGIVLPRALHGTTTIWRTATTNESVSMLRIKVIVIIQVFTCLDVADGVNTVTNVPFDVYTSHPAVRVTRVVDETGEVGIFPSVDIVSVRQCHDVKIGIIWMLPIPILQALFFFLFVDNFSNVFLHKFPFGNELQCHQTPPLPSFSPRLALDELFLAQSSISTVFCPDVTVDWTNAFCHDHAIEAIFCTGLARTRALFTVVLCGSRDLFGAQVFVVVVFE
mmetsp:Transcript_1643/g.3052  ORF Transcript_1643/g.3052 Transcript_1643/m.3052 type:complete len:261 (+) Transcript_1643:315-1097(+)